MNEKVIAYFENEKHMKSSVYTKMIEKLQKHVDIWEEFNRWLDTREYKFEKPVDIDGYTAEKIFEIAPFLDGVGVFNFLVTLKEKPETAKEYIAQGFPRK